MPDQPNLTTESLHQLMPFARTLGIELVAATPDEVRCRLPWQQRLEGAGVSRHRDRLQSEENERMADQVPVVCDVLATIEARNWDRLARLLHPEVHWTTAAEDELHGPDAVIGRLSGDPPPAPPSYHEVRDGLVWRWIDCPG